MTDATDTKISVWRWFAQGLRIVIRHWPLFTIGALAILALELLALFLNPEGVFIATFPGSPAAWITPSGAWPQLTVLDLLVHLILVPMILLGMQNVGAEAASGSQPTFSTLIKPFRHPLRAFGAMGFRCFSIAWTLLLLVFPGIMEWNYLAFGPLIALRDRSLSVVAAATRSSEVVFKRRAKMFVFRGVVILVASILLEMILLSLLLDHAITGVIAMFVAFLLFPPWITAALGSAYSELAALHGADGEELRGRTPGSPNQLHRTWTVSTIAILGVSAILLASVVAARVGLPHSASLDGTAPEPFTSALHETDHRIMIGEINAAGFMPDKQSIAIATGYGIEIRRTLDFGLIAGTERGYRGVEVLAVDPTGELLATASRATLSVIDSTTFDVVWSKESERQPTALAFDPRGQYLLCGYWRSAELSIFEAGSGTVVQHLDTSGACNDRYQGTLAQLCEKPDYCTVEYAQWSSDGSRVLAWLRLDHPRFGETQRFAVMFDVQTGKVIPALLNDRPTFTDRPGEIAVDNLIIDLSTDERIQLETQPTYGSMSSVSLASWGQARHVLVENHRVTITHLDSMKSRTVSLERSVRKRSGVEVEIGDLTLRLPWVYRQTSVTQGQWGNAPFGYFAISHDLRWMLAWSLGRIRLWDLASGKQIYDLVSPYQDELRFLTTRDEIGFVGSSSDGCGVLNLALPEPRIVARLDPNARAATSNEDEALCAVLGIFDQLSIYHIADLDAPVYEIDMSPDKDGHYYNVYDSRELAFTGNGSLVIWRNPDMLAWTPGEEPQTILKAEGLLAVDLSSTQLAGVDSRGAITVWDLDTMTPTAIATIQTASSMSLAVSDSGTALAVEVPDVGLVLYNVDDLSSRILTLDAEGLQLDSPGESDEPQGMRYVKDACFLGDGRYVAAIVGLDQPYAMGMWDESSPAEWVETAVVWDVDSGEQIFATPGGYFRSVNPWSTHGIAVCTDHDILFFKIPGLGEDDAQDD